MRMEHADAENVCSARKLHFIPPPPAVDVDDGDGVECCDLKSTEMCTRLQMLENAPATVLCLTRVTRACAFVYDNVRSIFILYNEARAEQCTGRRYCRIFSHRDVR